MEKPSTFRNKSLSSLDTDLPIEVKPKSGYNFDTVSIRSLIDGKVKVTGTVTGNEYIFSRSGDIQSVDIRDKDELLNKKRGRSCCGGTGGKHLFELVEE